MNMADMTIELRAEPDDLTPKQAERIHGFAAGFAEAVQAVKKKATGRWGWCTVVVCVTIGKRTAERTLGGSSYESETDFVQNSGYFMDLVNECLAEINS